MTDSVTGNGTWKKRIRTVVLMGIMGVLTACSTAAMSSDEMNVPRNTAPAESVAELTTESFAETMPQDVAVTEATSLVEETTEEELTQTEPRIPVGHQIIYSDGEIYGWTRYEYNDQGRKSMIIFITPTGEEYWSPIYYDGNGHVIPETVGDWSELNEDGLYLNIGTQDSRKRRTPVAEYAYDEKGNLTDYWYMFVSGRYQRHVIYQYDSQDRLVREELCHGRTGKLLSYITYIYDGQGYLIRMNEVEEGRSSSSIQYTLYQYDENGRLTREEKIWGGRVHDYVEYTYNQVGELLTEYHYLEDPMMGGPFTVEYIYEEIVNEEAN